MLVSIIPTLCLILPMTPITFMSLRQRIRTSLTQAPVLFSLGQQTPMHTSVDVTPRSLLVMIIPEFPRVLTTFRVTTEMHPSSPSTSELLTADMKYSILLLASPLSRTLSLLTTLQSTRLYITDVTLICSTSTPRISG